MNEYILEANHLTKTYTQRSGRFGFAKSQVKALNDVSIKLRTGKTLAVVGESGSGKSTLARCLLQLQSIDSGEVIFSGKDLAKLNAESLRSVRKDLQMVFQDPFASLNPRMRVGDLVGVAALARVGGEQLVVAPLGRLALEDDPGVAAAPLALIEVGVADQLQAAADEVRVHLALVREHLLALIALGQARLDGTEAVVVQPSGIDVVAG